MGRRKENVADANEKKMAIGMMMSCPNRFMICDWWVGPFPGGGNQVRSMEGSCCLFRRLRHDSMK